MELADTAASKAAAERREGSSPSPDTNSSSVRHMTALIAAALLIIGILGLTGFATKVVLAVTCLVAGVLLLVAIAPTLRANPWRR